MKKISVVIILLIFFSVIAGSIVNAQTELPHLFIRHVILDYYDNGDNTITLDYKLVVENTGVIPISHITFTLVPLFITATEEVVLNIEDLPAGAQSEVIFHIETPLVLPQDEMIKQPLLWIARYSDDMGVEHDAPLESYLDPFLSEGGSQ